MFINFPTSWKSLFYTIVFALLCFVPRAFSAQEFYPFVAGVTADNVHIRSGQSDNFESLLKVDAGQQLVVVDKSYSWYKIELPEEAKSFVSSEFVLRLQEGQGLVTANRLNIRSGAGPRHSVLGQLNEGQEVEILEEKEHWLRIRPVDGTYGWVSEDFVAFKSKDVKAFHKQQEFARKARRDMVQAQENAVSQQNELTQKTEDTDIKASDLKKKIEEALAPTPVLSTEPAGTEAGSVPSAEEKARAAVWGAFKAIKKTGEEDESFVSVQGNIKPQQEIKAEDIKYKFLKDGQTVFYIKGFQHILEEFLNFKVELEGAVITGEPSQGAYPVVEIHKIQLVL